MVNNLLLNYHDLYYNFGREEAKQFYKYAGDALEKIKEKYEKGNSTDVQILSSLDTILHLIKNLAEENMVVNL